MQKGQHIYSTNTQAAKILCELYRQMSVWMDNTNQSSRRKSVLSYGLSSHLSFLQITQVCVSVVEL